ncbi:unannotated protein [freshwater metagenome]|uniref:Unannotated protein n=1 Tax=freshwater metagenome TaxID=449393 RepID=A0A6J6EPY8_9ZZZZ
MRVFAIGVPMGIVSSEPWSFHVVDQMVVSVGPYMLVTLPVRELATRSFASCTGNASPPT